MVGRRAKREAKLLRTIADNVRSLREEQGHTQQRLAELSSLDIKTINRVEAADNNLTVVALESLAFALNVPPSQLLAEAHEQVPSSIEADVRKAALSAKQLSQHLDKIKERIKKPKRAPIKAKV